MRLGSEIEEEEEKEYPSWAHLGVGLCRTIGLTQLPFTEDILTQVVYPIFLEMKESVAVAYTSVDISS